MPINFHPVENYGTIQDFQFACEEGNAIELATFYGTSHNYGVWMLERLDFNDPGELGSMPLSTWVVVQLPHEKDMTPNTQHETDIYGMPVEQYSYGVSPFDAIKLAAMLVVAEESIKSVTKWLDPKTRFEDLLGRIKWLAQ